MPRRRSKRRIPKPKPKPPNNKTNPCQPPFPLYTNPRKPSFAEGWSSVVTLLRGKKNIAVLTGAGISVACGIPDFRTKGSGLYSTLDADALGLTCPEELFDIHFFRENPKPFYAFARQLYFPLQSPDQSDNHDPPQRIRPSDSHKLLSLLEQKKMLLRVYSQNIDGLEEEAGVSTKKVCYAHGSLQWAACRSCKRKVNAKDIEHYILKGNVAYCQVPVPIKASRKVVVSTKQQMVREPSQRTANRKRSHAQSLHELTNEDKDDNEDDDDVNKRIGRNGEAVCGGVMKPGVTFFGEALHNTVKSKLETDREKVDALIVIGTSLSVAPISKVIDYLPPNIPRILINRTIVHPPNNPEGNDIYRSDDCEEEVDFRDNYVFDAYLLGFCDDVTRALGKRLFATPENNTTDASEEEEGDILTTILDGDTDDSSYSVEDWENVSVPPSRVFLFPGAQAPTGESEDVPYHEIAKCDGCFAEITHTIQKCSDCFDYDLCRDCFPLLSKSHYDGKHHFTTEVVARGPRHCTS